jgi:hypothetical protein
MLEQGGFRMRSMVYGLGLMLLLSGGWGLFLMLSAAWSALADQWGWWPSLKTLEVSVARQAAHQRIPVVFKP